MPEVKKEGFRPVVLNELGETLIPWGQGNDIDPHSEWGWGAGIGCHKYTINTVIPRIISDTHAVLTTSGYSYMRIVIPIEVNTIEKLRTHFAEFNPDRGGGGNDGGYNDAVREMRVAQE